MNLDLDEHRNCIAFHRALVGYKGSVRTSMKTNAGTMGEVSSDSPASSGHFRVGYHEELWPNNLSLRRFRKIKKGELHLLPFTIGYAAFSTSHPGTPNPTKP